MLVRVLANWMVMAAAVWVATALLPGIHVHGGFVTYLALSLLFGLVNAVVGPLLHLVALPLSVFTVGGAALVVNGVLLLLTALLSARLDVAGLGSAILGSLVISIVTTVVEWWFGRSGSRTSIRWPGPAERARPALRCWAAHASPGLG